MGWTITVSVELSCALDRGQSGEGDGTLLCLLTMLIGMPASLMPVQHGFSRHTTSHPTLRGAALHTLYGGWLPPARDAAFMLSTTRTCMFQMVAFATCWMLPETYLRLAAHACRPKYSECHPHFVVGQPSLDFLHAQSDSNKFRGAVCCTTVREQWPRRLVFGLCLAVTAAWPRHRRVSLPAAVAVLKTRQQERDVYEACPDGGQDGQ